MNSQEKVMEEPEIVSYFSVEPLYLITPVIKLHIYHNVNCVIHVIHGYFN